MSLGIGIAIHAIKISFSNGMLHLAVSHLLKSATKFVVIIKSSKYSHQKKILNILSDNITYQIFLKGMCQKYKKSILP